MQLQFTTTKLNDSTFVIEEHDSFNEHPLIYVKICHDSPAIVLTDTGCGTGEHHQAANLRSYIETHKQLDNGDEPLNPNGEKPYHIICTHCHFDHTLGIPQFLASSNKPPTIIASAAGRDFIESDLARHGLFDLVDRPAPIYNVTHWAEDNEHYSAPPLTINGGASISNETGTTSDLNITFLQTPGHTPDSLSWYDAAEKWLYIGDCFYDAGEHNMPVVWPMHGDLVVWSESMRGLRGFVARENATLAGEGDERRVKLAAGHQTSHADAAEILYRLEAFWQRVLHGKVPGVEFKEGDGIAWGHWRERDLASGLWFRMPVRLMEEARRHFGIDPGSGRGDED